MWEEYQYVDVKHRSSRKWQRILRADVRRWLDDNPEQEDYYCTIQTFKGTMHKENERHYCPFFVDFDSDSLEESLKDARQLVDYFLVGHEVEPQVWFSGNRGFHVTVEAVAFGAEPDSNLTYIWRHLAERIVKQLGLSTLDKRVYSRRRMWRLENTKHAKSGLHKIPLSLSIFRTETVENIREMAVEPHVLAQGNESEESPHERHKSLAVLYNECAGEFRDRQTIAESTPVEYFFLAARRRVCNIFWRKGLQS